MRFEVRVPLTSATASDFHTKGGGGGEGSDAAAGGSEAMYEANGGMCFQIL